MSDPSAPSPAAADETRSRAYYDEFSKGYEKRRGDKIRKGYHDLLDHLEASFVERYGKGKEVLEVGCGTGLVLQRIAQFASRAQGIDLSPGMLEKAKERGLDVVEGSATRLPFPDNSFDVTCSFKVLAHIPEIDLALSEMARVTRPGGTILAEFYNPKSLRGLLRKMGPARKIGTTRNEADVFTRFDSPKECRELTPADCHFDGARGVRIITPFARLVDTPLIGSCVYGLENFLADSPLKEFAGFYIARYTKHQRP
ncbi:MAG: methyltransferase domain-containing protein [Polyangiaceae bacterium]|nr:methyltransferase domain-containing protein [Polyangiaceae bacterium]